MLNETEIVEPIRAVVETRSVKAMLDLMQSGEWVFPEYQRNPQAWGNDKRSWLIESAMMGLPIPAIFTAKNGRSLGSRDVVDGIQRLSAFRAFVAGDFKLHYLSYLTQFMDRKFDRLPQTMQEQILETKITVCEVPRKTPWGDTGEILFKRLNLNTPLKPGEWINTRSGPRFREIVDIIKPALGDISQDRMKHVEMAATWLAALLSTVVVDPQTRQHDLELPNGVRLRTGSNEGHGQNQSIRFWTAAVEHLEETSAADFLVVRDRIRLTSTSLHLSLPGKVSKLRTKPGNLTMFLQARIAAKHQNPHDIRVAWVRIREQNPVLSQLPELADQIDRLG